MVSKNLESVYLSLVAGNWGAFGAWSVCSKSCGNGTRNRTRKCDNPEPQHGGADCVGDDEENESCNSHPCPSEY